MTMVNYDETVKNITDKIIEKYSKDSLEVLSSPKFNDENTSFVSNDVVNKEVVLMMLMDKYAESMHSQMQAKEELEKAGYSEVQILNLRQGYCGE